MGMPMTLPERKPISQPTWIEDARDQKELRHFVKNEMSRQGYGVGLFAKEARLHLDTVNRFLDGDGFSMHRVLRRMMQTLGWRFAIVADTKEAK